MSRAISAIVGMIGAMFGLTRRAHLRRWIPALLAAVLAVAIGLLGAAPASAATGSAAQNGVGASTSASQVTVGPSASISAGQRLGHDPPQPQIVVATGVAAETAGSASGLPRNALGQFTSGAGGESAAAAAGRSAHASYPNTSGWSGEDLVQFNRTLPGSSLRPDAVNWTQSVVGELKPGNPSAVAAGWRQVNGYKAYLEELTGRPWTTQVDVYTP
ncbi:MAG TPA: hypothetical protein VGC18_07505 [Lacisediminihabitans sp.]|uniref:hypothetical protein n=1 Tax=Lacisediminihabitans sp. TaxID=2787631 RepID=UPI002EDB842E